MVDFNTSQLTWIVIGICSIGGGGYISLNDNVKNIDTKLQVTQQKITNVDTNMVDLKKQLDRMEEKMDKKK